MKMKSRLILALCMVLMIVATIAINLIYTRTQLEMTQVVMAKHKLAARTQITQEDLSIVEVPKAFLSDQVVMDADDIIGDFVSLDGFIPSGSLIYRSMVEKLDDAIDEPSLLLKPGQAVMALDVNLTSSAGNTLMKGQKIDVYGTIKINRETIVDVLIKQVRVIGVKDKNGEDVTHSGNQIPKILLLAIDQESIPAVTKLLAIGDITLTPTAYNEYETECVENETSLLWETLNVR